MKTEVRLSSATSMTTSWNPVTLRCRKLKLQDPFTVKDLSLGFKHKASSSEQLWVLLQQNLHLCRRVPHSTHPKRRDPSPPLLAVDRKRQCDVERVVVLDQGRVLVVENQLLQRTIQVVGLSKPKAGAGLVDDAMLYLSVHTEREREREQLEQHSKAEQTGKQETGS